MRELLSEVTKKELMPTSKRMGYLNNFAQVKSYINTYMTNTNLIYILYWTPKVYSFLTFSFSFWIFNKLSLTIIKIRLKLQNEKNTLIWLDFQVSETLKSFSFFSQLVRKYT